MAVVSWISNKYRYTVTQTSLIELTKMNSMNLILKDTKVCSVVTDKKKRSNKVR